MKLVEVELENNNDIKLIDYFEDESKLTGEDFRQQIPVCNHNTFNIQQLNYFVGNVNICNIDKTNDLRTHFIVNNRDLNIKSKLELLKDNYKNYWNLPEDFLFSIAREKLGEKWDYEDIKRRRKEWIAKKKKEEEEDKQENRFERELEKQKKVESNFKWETKTLHF